MPFAQKLLTNPKPNALNCYAISADLLTTRSPVYDLYLNKLCSFVVLFFIVDISLPQLGGHVSPQLLSPMAERDTANRVKTNCLSLYCINIYFTFCVIKKI